MMMVKNYYMDSRNEKIFITLIFFGLMELSAFKVAADKWFPASIRVEAPQDVIRAIAQSGFGVDRLAQTHCDLYVTEKEYQQLLVRYRSKIDAGLVSIAFTQTHAQALSNIQGSGGSFGVGYHSYPSMLEELEGYVQQAPGLCMLVEFGKSASTEHGLWAFKISDNVELEEDEPSVLLVAGIHGNEYPGVEQVLYTIKHIIENRGDRAVGSLIDHTQIWFVPMLNPDGHAVQSRYNINDVDLNRNFPIIWGDYAEYEALSESETRSFVQNLLQQYRFALSLDYHTYGKMYMYPWGHTSNKPVDFEVFETLSGAMASQAEYKSGSLFNLIGLVYGGTVDYYYGAYGTIALAAELGESHIPPVEELETILDANLAPALKLIGRAQIATVTGKVTRAGRPIEAEVYVKGIDYQKTSIRAPCRSDKTFGRYHRILEPGSYDLVFVSENQSIIHSGVSVVPDAQTVLDVEFDDPVPDGMDENRGCACAVRPQRYHTGSTLVLVVAVVAFLYRKRRFG